MYVAPGVLSNKPFVPEFIGCYYGVSRNSKNPAFVGRTYHTVYCLTNPLKLNSLAAIVARVEISKALNLLGVPGAWCILDKTFRN